MEEFFQYDYTTPINFPDRSRSAFIPYIDHRTGPNPIRSAAGGGRNVNRRLIEFLRSSWSNSREPEVQRERGYRHMMNERMRREKQKQSYSTLRSLLPHGTKNDKNTIVQVAAREVEELERRRRELENQNRAMAARLATDLGKEEDEERGFKKIMVKVTNPSCGVHSIVEVLKCLRNNGFKAKSIQSSFSNHEISALLQILFLDKEHEEAQALVRQTLIEVERKFTHNSLFQESA